MCLQAINAAEVRRMERDLEASRLYADASEEKAQADRIIAMGLQLEGAVISPMEREGVVQELIRRSEQRTRRKLAHVHDRRH